jgi:uncharacterized membrane protein YadS
MFGSFMKVLVSHIGKAIEKLESGGSAVCGLSAVMAKVMECLPQVLPRVV